jgi:hypothetical protein
MNWSHEQTVKAGSGHRPIKADNIEIAFDEETETGHVPKRQLEAANAAAAKALGGIAGDRLLTVTGHEDAGEAPNAQHLIVTVSRMLVEDGAE